MKLASITSVFVFSVSVQAAPFFGHHKGGKWGDKGDWDDKWDKDHDNKPWEHKGGKPWEKPWDKPWHHGGWNHTIPTPSLPIEWPTAWPTSFPTGWPTEFPTDWLTSLPTEWPHNISWPTDFPCPTLI